MLIISSKDNQNIKNTVKLKKSAKYRKQSGLFLAEGLRVCFDAMLSGAKIETLFVTENAAQKHFEKYNQLSEYAGKTFVVTPELFSIISDTQTPQGFLCVIKALDKTKQFDTIKNGGKFLALDNVQDPNNLGTILRSAEAFGISGVVMSSDCCDIYSPKVVRGSMGAVFRLPFIIYPTIAQFLNDNPALNSYAAVVDSKAQSITDICFTEPCVAVVGNEGNGLKDETIIACNNKITIPMKGKAESLNASTAASIIIWEMIR
ncbi:MAG: RNA methyltransferase [Ruminococcus bromii]|nr:RNA methyltransferase [Ruminococcus bromii]MCI7211868.1 RNA methyltransferase [Ruminococcus bromii]MDD6433882.1 RNA methyltransferase [Ruminococcus bromii]MDY4084694.1 RNA methyltransferase [Ruminococcus bromii]MDY4710821.1 RNA methyltransferase [Ruminococcus bromii]